MKRTKGIVKIITKPERILYYSEFMVKLRAEDVNTRQKGEFDKNFLSEVDVDRILAIA